MTDAQPTQYHNFREQQRAFLTLTQSVAEAHHLDEAVAHMLSVVLEVAKAACVRLVARDDSGAWESYGAGAFAERAAEMDTPIYERVAERGAFTWTPSEEALSRALAELAAVVALPLWARGHLQGVLWLGFEQPDALDESDRIFLETVAAQAALLIAETRAFERVQKQHKWLAAVLHYTPDPVLVVDCHFRLQLINPAARKLFPELGEETIGHPLAALERMGGLLEILRASAEYDDDAPPEYRLDEERTFAVNLSDVRDADGEMVGWVVVLQDITRFKRLHDNMADFLSTVSHDMRTPLTFMKGYLDMLGMVGPLSEKQTQFVEKIASGFLQMSDMVDKILKAGRLDPVTGTYRLEREPCDLVEVFSDVVNGLSGPAKEKGLDFTYQVDGNIPVLNVDRDLVSSAFTNLVENAIKYTPEGGRVEVALGVRNNEVVFRVTDNGYGISPENQRKLFRRNVRIHRKEWKRIKGSGLGLFIVRNVAQRHGGDTWVESEEGKGSTFYFTIPLDGANLIGSGAHKHKG